MVLDVRERKLLRSLDTDSHTYRLFRVTTSSSDSHITTHSTPRCHVKRSRRKPAVTARGWNPANLWGVCRQHRKTCSPAVTTSGSTRDQHRCRLFCYWFIGGAATPTWPYHANPLMVILDGMPDAEHASSTRAGATPPPLPLPSTPPTSADHEQHFRLLTHLLEMTKASPPTRATAAWQQTITQAKALNFMMLQMARAGRDSQENYSSG